MLNLPLATTDGTIVATDHDRSDVRYVAARHPRVALRPDGNADISMLRWRSADSDRAVTGGRLSLGLTLSADLPRTPESDLPDDMSILPMPWTDATVTVHGPGFSAATVAVAYPDQQAVGIVTDLDSQSADVLDRLLSGGTLAGIQIVWSGRILARLPDVDVRASAARDDIARRLAQVPDAARQDALGALLDANLTFAIDAGGDISLERQLRTWAVDELARRFDQDKPLLVRAQAADIIDWPLVLSAALDDKLPPSTDRVTSITLSDAELGRRQSLEVRVAGRWPETLARTDIQIDQGGAVVDAALTGAEPARVSLENGPYRFRWRYLPAAHPSTRWTDWKHGSSRRSLLIPAPPHRQWLFETTASALDFTGRWQAVDVVLTLRDDAGGSSVERFSLSPGQLTRRTGMASEQTAVSAMLRFVSISDAIVEKDVTIAPNDTVLQIRDPYSNHRRQVALVPVGSGWRDISRAMVELAYDDGDLHWRETLALDSFDAMVEWQVPARPDGPGEYRWRLHASFRDGRFEQSRWQTSDARLLSIPLVSGSRRQLQVLPLFLSAAETATLEIESGADSRTVEIADRRPLVVDLVGDQYRWRVRWHTAAGSTHESAEVVSGGDVIVIPRSPSE